MFDEDYLEKLKYSRLLSRMNQIKSEVDTTNRVFKDIYSLCKETVKIDNKCMEDDSFQEIKEIGSDTISSITSTVSSIHSKL